MICSRSLPTGAMYFICHYSSNGYSQLKMSYVMKNLILVNYWIANFSNLDIIWAMNSKPERIGQGYSRERERENSPAKCCVETERGEDLILSS